MVVMGLLEGCCRIDTGLSSLWAEGQGFSVQGTQYPQALEDQACAITCIEICFPVLDSHYLPWRSPC